jgi:metal-responsive CopG/Arc/MetJ family transcriptional regulator
MTKRIQVSMPDEMVDALRRRAEETDRDLSSQIRRAIRVYFAKYPDKP